MFLLNHLETGRQEKNLITNCLGTVEVVGKDAKILITNCLETEEVEMQ